MQGIEYEDEGMKSIIPKLLLIIFALWLVFSFTTQSGKFKPLPDYPDGYLPMDLEERVDFWLDCTVELPFLGVGCEGQILVSSGDGTLSWKTPD